MQQSIVGKWGAIVLFAILLVLSQGGLIAIDFKVTTMADPFFVQCMLVWSTALIYTVAMVTVFWMKPDTKLAPWKNMCEWGLLQGCGILLLLFSAPHLSGIYLAVLGPGVMTVPWGMFVSMVFLKKRFDLGRYIAVGILFSGIVVSVIVQITHTSTSNLPSNKIPEALWAVFYACGSLFFVLQFIRQELCFATLPARQNAIYINWGTFSSMAVVVIPLMAPIDLIPQFGQSNPSNFFAKFYYNSLCMFGYTVPTNYLPSHNEDYCTSGALGLNCLLMVGTYIVFNISILLVLQLTSALFQFIVSTISTPVGAILFSLPFFMRPLPYQEFHFLNILSLGLLVAGMFTYAYFEFKVKPAPSAMNELDDDYDSDADSISALVRKDNNNTRYNT